MGNGTIMVFVMFTILCFLSIVACINLRKKKIDIQKPPEFIHSIPDVLEEPPSLFSDESSSDRYVSDRQLLDEHDDYEIGC
jgi:hypothetical protein